MALVSDGQWGPEALLDVGTGKVVTDATVTVPSGYTALLANGNLTVIGPPGPVTFQITRNGVNSDMTVTVPPAVTEVAEVAGLARGALPTATAASDYATLPEALRPTTRTPVAATETVVTTFQSGHGWLADGTGTASLDDTSVFTLGTQSAGVTTNGAGAVQRLTKTGLALDLTGKMLRFKMRVSDRTKLGDLIVFVGSGGSWANYHAWTLYDAINLVDTIDTWPGTGEWVEVTIPFSTPAATTGTPNRAAIERVRFAVRDRSSGAVTFHVNKVSVVPEPTQWPNGVVSITFDDGWASQFTEAKRRMDAYAMPGTAYVICDIVGTAGYLTLAQCRQMQNDSGWEIAPHAYSIANHNRAEGFNELSGEELNAELRQLKAWLVDNGFWRGADHLAWPRSRFDAARIAAARSFFASGRTTQRQHESWPPADLFRLRSMNIGASTTVASVQTAIDAAKANKSWLILTFHEIRADAASGTQITPANFQAIIDHVNSQGVPVRTVGDVLRTS